MVGRCTNEIVYLNYDLCLVCSGVYRNKICISNEEGPAAPHRSLSRGRSQGRSQDREPIMGRSAAGI